MIRIRNPSLELNWLPNSIRKGITTPRIYLLEEEKWGGFYSRRTDDRCIPSDVDIDLKEGAAIVLCGLKTIGSLAHEYRHHWQVESGYRFGASIWAEQTEETYQESIVRYFRTFPWEMDALKFQIAYAPDDCSLQWREWLM